MHGRSEPRVFNGLRPAICDEAENRLHVQKALMALTM